VPSMQTRRVGVVALSESAVDYRHQTFGELRDHGVRVAIRCVPCRRRSYPDCTDADMAERTPASARFSCAKCGAMGLVLFVPPKRMHAKARKQRPFNIPRGSIGRAGRLPP
jgi:hypothetical protein